ncbi:hypothetical protein C2S53_001740 [Perilla frutescens var. hirtella]|uniref:SNRNP25 ubiquitin-like domain-containing protein n=1 Tax=Perilla frutescens var. hirtella TaxID=608512 RepID=A0AAD4PB40_PERFH|nr:hypothetical protein C2S53_001740 [Perilla frutescens var. hirtella]
MVKVLPKTHKKHRPRKKLIPFSLYNRTLTYRKLPEQQFLNLSVLKLDGSSFSVHVARNATVAGLKFAVEEEFNLFPKDERTKLWALVWSHFCLCYEGQKLIRDVACIQKYGIKDGDQLRFIQHLRMDLAPTQTTKQSKDPTVKSKQGATTSGVDARRNHHSGSEDECAELRYSHCGEEELLPLRVPEPKSRLTGSLKELLSCSKF